MIKKQTAKDNNIKIIDSQQILTDEKTALIAQLKALLPNVINSDNQLDTKSLNDVLDLANTTSNNQGYELTFAGKGIARAMASKPTELELQAEISQSKDFDNTQNTVIRGDNLEVLKILQGNYHNKIKMIYIDPPYNTKNENFIYKDNFKQSDADLIDNFALDEEAVDFLQNVYGTRSHSGWLSFIYPRLKLARDLLTDDGVIFISIDDNEQANLKILCDEIFGEDNFVGNIAWESKTKSQNTRDSFSKLQPKVENIFCYSKDKKRRFNLYLNGVKEYSEVDDEGRFRYSLIEEMNATGIRGRESMVFPIKGITPKSGKQWKIGKEKINIFADRKDLIIKNKKPYLKMRPEDERKEKTIPFWAFFSKNEGTAESAKKELSSILETDKHGFETVKPTNIIKKLVFHSTTTNGIILDFFAGSGTTADAVMQLNFEDGGKRKFILVQLDEKIDKKKNAEAHKFCTDNNFKPVISSITIERLNRAGEKIKADLSQKSKDLFADKKLPDIGYKVFSCTKKPQVMQQQNENENVFLVENQRHSTLDTLTNMLVATCKTLDSKITCLIKDKLYQADDEIYLLANIDKETLAKYRNKKVNLDGWADIDLTQYLNLDVKNNDNINVIY